MNTPGPFGAAFQHDTSHFWNDIARAANDDGVSDANIFSVQLVDIVQGGVADRDTANKYRLQSAKMKNLPTMHMGPAYGRVSNPPLQT